MAACRSHCILQVHKGRFPEAQYVPDIVYLGFVEINPIPKEAIVKAVQLKIEEDDY